MASRARRFAIALLSVSIMTVVFAQTPALDVRMGLWEVTSVMKTAGDLPFDTSKLTPEQKAQIEAAMKNQMGQPQTTVQKNCMTKEKFEKSIFMADSPGMTCKQTLTTNTRSTIEGREVCTGTDNTSMTIQMHMDAQSQTAVKGTVKASAVTNGKTITSDGTMTAKWLGADCGNTK